MDKDRSRDAMMEFLEYVATKGLMPTATARARKAAASKVLSILEDSEADDVTSVDVDEVMGRFANLQGQNYTPDSLATYRSRVKSSIEDFNRYLENPLAFKPSSQVRERKSPTGKAEKKGVAKSPQRPTPNAMSQHAPSVARSMADTILPIPIRSDLTVYVQGLPFDLTVSEANKIANVIKAMAASE